MSVPLRSSFADDPEMRELLIEFAKSIEETLARLAAAIVASDWEGLGRLGHQLKGAGGSYGFPQISEAGARLERIAADGHATEDLRQSLGELANLLRQARDGILVPDHH